MKKIISAISISVILSPTLASAMVSSLTICPMTDDTARQTCIENAAKQQALQNAAAAAQSKSCSLTAEQRRFTAGDSVDLHGIVKTGTAIAVNSVSVKDQNGKTYYSSTNSGEFNISDKPNQETAYTLTALFTDNTSCTSAITVMPKCLLNASATEVNKADAVRLSWYIGGASESKLYDWMNNGQPLATGNTVGSATVYPKDSDSTYVVKSKVGGDDVSCVASIHVKSQSIDTTKEATLAKIDMRIGELIKELIALLEQKKQLMSAK